MIFAGEKLTGLFVFDRFVIDIYNQGKVVEVRRKESESHFDGITMWGG